MASLGDRQYDDAQKSRAAIGKSIAGAAAPKNIVLSYLFATNNFKTP